MVLSGHRTPKLIYGCSFSSRQMYSIVTAARPRAIAGLVTLHGTFPMVLLKYSPNFSLEEATALAREIYGVCAMASALPSERDQNFLLHDQSGEKFVLKIANALEDRALLEAQQQAMSWIAERARLSHRIARTQSGDPLTEIQSASGVSHFVWM